jgi:peptide/nickel transport system permease protein
MLSYVTRRIINAVAVVFIVTFFVFVLTRLLPGSEARAILGPQHATPATIRQFDVEHGLNRPLVDQYLIYVRQLLHGDLGFSYNLNQSVNSIIAERLPRTAALLVPAIILGLAVAIPVGIYQAIHQHSTRDYSLTVASFVGYSMPTFWLSLLLIAVFSQRFHLFPPQGPMGGVSSYPSQLASMVLPIMTMTVLTIAIFTRYVRAAVSDNLVEEYVRTAHANGLSPPRVLFGHVLRNSVGPIISLMPTLLPALLSASLVVEAVFNSPGLGLLVWNSAQTRDYPVLLGATLVVSVITVLASLVADLIYALIDPRIVLGAR